ncbi:STAS domain-containing protein [Marinobacter halodurans]|uniref:STAS domain-containing protein n=1 Tax=Marinobacter halodurans TaxID=2528979 RepID=A0ABY1ZPN8_9GAMM|nr:STAS domain-containing protein [Marinobacter halodurans]TBW56799.1 STAS domain-containing protein [Marinobacter halodurans]
MTSVQSVNMAGDAVSGSIFQLTSAQLDRDVLALRKQGEAFLAEQGGGECSIDLAGIDRASSVLVSLMLCWKRKADQQGVALGFAGVSDRLVELARMGNVADYLGLTG